MKKPEAIDGILGGQTPPPIDSPTLGGIQGLQQQMTMASSEQRSQCLATALNYGEAGIDLLINTLKNDPVLTVRAMAHQHLQSIDTSKATAAIARGIPLKQGDRLYRVYISAIDYDDEYHTLLDSVQAYEAHDFCYDGELLHPVDRYVFREQAERVAQDLHRVILSNGDFAEFNRRHHLNLKPLDYYLVQIAEDLAGFYRNFNQPIKAWCVEHSIDIDFTGYVSEGVSEDDDAGEWWEAQEVVLQKLRCQGDYALLQDLCTFIGIGKFAFVHEEVVDRDGFFTITKQS